MVLMALALEAAPMALAVQALALKAALTIFWHHIQMQER